MICKLGVISHSSKLDSDNTPSSELNPGGIQYSGADLGDGAGISSLSSYSKIFMLPSSCNHQ